jgi:AraC-like DNA-binding protein
MDIALIDAITRIAGITLLLTLAALLLRDGGRRAPAVFFAPLALCLSGFVAGNSPDAAAQLHGWPAATAHILSGYAAIFLWWFSLACFDRDFRPRGVTLALGIAWFLIASADRGLFGPGLGDLDLSRLLVPIGLVIVAHLIWTLLQGREGDLLPRRRDARVIVAVLLGGQLLLDLSIDLILGFDWKPRSFTIAQNLIVMAFTLWLGARLLTARAAVLEFSAPEPRPISGTDAAPPGPTDDIADPRLLAQISELVEIDRIHLDPDLSFADFVARTGFPERAVRRAINHALGHDHFRSFLNQYRVDEACRLLAANDRSAEKLVGVALDSGFASLASFNRAFRQRCGCTPSQYRETLLRGGKAPQTEGPAGF